MIRSFRSDHTCTWRHRDNGSHGDSDRVSSMLGWEQYEVTRGALSVGDEQREWEKKW